MWPSDRLAHSRMTLPPSSSDACGARAACATDGKSAAVTDYLVHLSDWETVNARYESDLPADVRRVRKPMPMA